MKRILTAALGAMIITSSFSAADAKPRRHHAAKHHVIKHHKAKLYVKTYKVPEAEPSFFGGFSIGISQGVDAVSRARQHIGQSARQVGVRSTLWCSAFLRKVTGASGVDDRAKSWEAKPRIAPQVGAVVTMGRRGGGHAGIVSGFTDRGDPIVISGNHSGRVAESVYPRSRIRAWVSPS